jgi:hypothetical protein
MKVYNKTEYSTQNHKAIIDKILKMSLCHGFLRPSRPLLIQYLEIGHSYLLSYLPIHYSHISCDLEIVLLNKLRNLKLSNLHYLAYPCLHSLPCLFPENSMLVDYH